MVDGRYYCQCGREGNITVRVWYSGRYYCQSVVNWAIVGWSVVECAIFHSECGTMGNIAVRVFCSGYITIRVWYIR